MADVSKATDDAMTFTKRKQNKNTCIWTTFYRDESGLFTNNILLYNTIFNVTVHWHVIQNIWLYAVNI